MRGERGAGHWARFHDIGLSEAHLASKRPCGFWSTRRLDFVQSRQSGRLKGRLLCHKATALYPASDFEVVLRDDAKRQIKRHLRNGCRLRLRWREGFCVRSLL